MSSVRGLVLTNNLASDPSLFYFQVSVRLNPSNGKVIANEREQSSTSHIYAIGDMLDGKPELTPVAIQVKLQLRYSGPKNKKIQRADKFKNATVNV